jgi:hypothetical protein
MIDKISGKIASMLAALDIVEGESGARTAHGKDVNVKGG